MGPRAHLDRALSGPARRAGGDPAELAASRETVRLALGAALRPLPTPAGGALILREVLRWRAGEVAELLETSVASVNSALQRARTGARGHGHQRGRPRPAAGRIRRALLARCLDAFERDDVHGLARLLGGRRAADAGRARGPMSGDDWIVGGADGLAARHRRHHRQQAL